MKILHYDRNLYFGRHLILCITLKKDNDWEFNLLPFVTIDEWRVICGWLFFTLQYTYEGSKKGGEA